MYAWLTSVGLLSVFLMSLVVKFWLADSMYALAKSSWQEENYLQADQYIDAAINLRSGEPVFHDQKAVISSHLAITAMDENDATRAALYSQDAIKQSQMTLAISPQNVNFWKNRTKIFYQLSALEPDLATSALESILIARQLAPSDAKVAYNTAILYGYNSQNQQAINALQETIDLKPDYRDAYIALAIFYEQEKNYPGVKDTLEKVLQRINPQDQEVKDRLEQLKSRDNL